jgi:nucleotide-binding universal stress UspA family protein
MSITPIPFWWVTAYLGSRKNNLEFHERLILGSGRPVVVFPASGDVFRCGTRILVAWRGGREAARAVHDALPFLQQAAQVTVVSVVATPEERLQEQRALADLVAHLEHSRVRATTELVERRGRSIGEQVLERAAQLRADLIVVGGFAYKPNRAPVLSPLTRELLVSAPVPLMIAH